MMNESSELISSEPETESKKKLKADQEKMTFEELKEEIANATDCPTEDLLCLQEALADADQVLSLITLLDLNKTRTRTRQMTPKKFKISLPDLEVLSAEIERQIVHLPQGQCVSELYTAAKAIESKIEEFLGEPLEKVESVRGMIELLEEVDSLDVNLKRSTELMDKIHKVKWYKKSLIVGKHEDDIDERDIQDFTIPMEKEDFRKFLEEGRKLECAGLRNNLVEMEDLWTRITNWDADAHQKITLSYDYSEIADLEKFLSDGEDIGSVCRPEHLAKFKSAVQRSKDWIKLIDKLRTIEYYPNLHILENLVRLGELLPFKFLELDHLKVHVKNGLDWIITTEKAFFGEKTDEKISLMKMLRPENFPDQVFLGSPTDVVATYKKCDHQKRTGQPEVVKPQSLRPTLDEVLQLLISLQRLPMRIPEGELLLCLTERAMSWEDKCKEFLSRKDVLSCVLKLDDTKDDCDLEMTKPNQEDLENLIFDGEHIEITLPDKSILWRLFHALKKAATVKKEKVLPTPVVEPVQQTPPEPTEVLGKRLRKTKNEDDEKSEPKKKTKKNFKSNNKKVEKVSSSDDEDDDEEECSAENCLNPTGREVDWVQCDGGCNKWFHMFCVGIKRNDVSAEDDYICRRCSSADVLAVNKV
ncbi:KDM5A.2 family protein [Megaselia abdita]